MKTRYAVFIIALILLISALTFAEEPRLVYDMQAKADEPSISSILKDGKDIGQFSWHRKIYGTKSLGVIISINVKNYPKAKDFKHIGTIAGRIYELVNGVGKEHKYKASVKVSDIYSENNPTFIEIRYAPEYSNLTAQEVEDLQTKISEFF